jgi:hypothetical protein
VTEDDPFEPFEVPDFVEPLQAWRVWRIVRRDGGYSLASAIKPTIWPAGEELVARCLRTSPVRRWWLRRVRGEPHREAPETRCDCGIYATDLVHLRHYLMDGLAPPAVARVLGLVSLWGTVVECERGYRASHAYPLHLYVPIDAAWQKKHCGDELVSGLESYDVPVEPLAARCSETVWVLEQRRQLAARERRA